MGLMTKSSSPDLPSPHISNKESIWNLTWDCREIPQPKRSERVGVKSRMNSQS